LGESNGPSPPQGPLSSSDTISENIMKKILWAGALLAAWLVLPVRAHANGLLPGRIDIGGNLYIRVLPQGYCFGPQVGPWYQYWPLEAHFHPPAPAAFPAWPPRPQSLPVHPQPPTFPGAAKAAYYPVGYYQQPAYWSGR
jgi:hypothetical protein